MRTLRIGSRGTDVKEVQSLLQRLGYYTGAIDGIFGYGTANAVIAFQRAYGLTPDGIVGPMTFGVMEPLLMGSIFVLSLISVTAAVMLFIFTASSPSS